MQKITPYAIAVSLLFLGAGCIEITTPQTAQKVSTEPDMVINAVYSGNTNAGTDVNANAAAPAENTNTSTNTNAGADAKAEAKLTFTGTVRDAATGQGVPDAAVNLKEVSLWTNTDVDGKYTITLPGAAVYTATVTKDQYEAGQAMTLDPEKGPYTVDFSAKAQDRANHTTVVPKAAYVKGTTGLKVKIQDADGAGLADVGFQTVGGEGVPGAKSRVTGSAGTFADHEIPPGTYRFSMRKYDEPVHVTFHLDFSESINDYIVTVMEGYSTELSLTVTK